MTSVQHTWIVLCWTRVLLTVRLTDLYCSSPRVYGSRIQPLRPIADKPNHVDPRTHGEMPGGFYNRDAQVGCFSLFLTFTHWFH